MSTERISGMSFDVSFNGRVIHVKTITLDVTDNTKAIQERGVPNGWVRGDAEASGELELDTVNFQLLGEAAREAGSWRDIEEADFLFFAQAAKTELRVEAFGCKLVLSNLLNIDSKGGDSLSHKIKYLVTSPEFVKIDGISILSATDVRDLMNR
ncbi:phage protein [Salmonella enterica]|uniref:phage protein n=1 Tax=Salmonella enterica TaxID=28901 RepID=UPI0009AF6393|nr:phage protein [Salmonella enterica]